METRQFWRTLFVFLFFLRKRFLRPYWNRLIPQTFFSYHTSHTWSTIGWRRRQEVGVFFNGLSREKTDSNYLMETPNIWLFFTFSGILTNSLGAFVIKTHPAALSIISLVCHLASGLVQGKGDPEGQAFIPFGTNGGRKGQRCKNDTRVKELHGREGERLRNKVELSSLVSPLATEWVGSRGCPSGLANHQYTAEPNRATSSLWRSVFRPFCLFCLKATSPLPLCFPCSVSRCPTFLQMWSDHSTSFVWFSCL